MARRNAFTSRRLGMESLEGRQMMAANVMGNVQVSVNNGGDLIVTGDGNQNNIQIVPFMQQGVATPGKFFVAIQNGTTLNGQTLGQNFEGVTRNININLGGGNDRLTLGFGGDSEDFIVPNDLIVVMGEGADVVNIDHISVRDDATITTGNGNDSVSFKGIVGDTVGVDKGANDLTIDTGARPDNVLVQDTFVRRNVLVTTGTDNFSDIVDLINTIVGDDATINTGDGGDIVRCTDVTFTDDLSISTGAGNDSVKLYRCQVDEFFAKLGAGTDTLELKDTTGRRAGLSGGTGVDTLLRTNSPFDSFQADSF